ncbi:MAG: hypothetical protein GF328_12530, partial [Candidatus Latescibacteria bacterium]|nr:hypothetical protein [Candidatus Latescibacterota bacterium]
MRPRGVPRRPGGPLRDGQWPRAGLHLRDPRHGGRELLGAPGAGFLHVRAERRLDLRRRPGGGRSVIRRLFRTARRVGRKLLLLALLLAAGLASLWLFVPLPEGLLAHRDPSPAVYDREGRPLLALAAPDGQWHLPLRLSRAGPWLARATVAVEDGRFRSHPGVDAAALLRAIGQNLGAGRVVSGASTITMQLCRLQDPGPRTLPTKLREAVRALKLERRLTKDEILERYLNLAPYGGNVVGAGTAARIWFGKAAADLSLPEAALLAGLPQSPTRYRPDVHPERARARRSRVLARMLAEGMIDEAQHREA